jgi:hypothetical protein
MIELACYAPIMSDKLVYQESTVRGFHGTDGVIAQTILSDGYKIGTTDRNYLGSGVYFFEDQLSKAKKWAKRCNSGTCAESKKIAVLLSKVRWGYCLNLTDEDCFKRLVDFKSQIQIKTSRKISLAAAVDIAVKALKADTVRAVRTPKGAELDELRFSADSEVILSVVNLSNITDTSVHWSGSADDRL